ncbi:MAG: hydantoinase B/oxoprolinase family protein [Thermomicrobiales bacterium]|nr:hydantoinase B/oxoprolinase family protein [Thermomicrobiales bacterium]
MQQIDAVRLEVMWNRLISVVNEQAAALMRTSFTSIVREAGDLSAGVFDARGNMIAQAVTGTPGHINAMATCIHHFLHVFPAATLRPGDVLVTNDPQKTSGHLHDFTVITPVFLEEQLVGFFGNTCHVLDIGGIGLSTDARSVFEEGLFVPITKLYDAGAPNTELLKILAANVRTPEPVLGDIHAQAAGNDVGANRLIEFMREFELTTLEPLADEIIARSERAMRQAIATLPDGVYQNEVWSDGHEEPVRLRVSITKKGDELDVDWAGSSPESKRGINVVLNYTHAYSTYALKCALAPDVPNNEGSFRPVRVTAPERSILNALPPAAVGARHILGHFLPGAIFGALAEVIPQRIMAEGAANIWNLQFMGHDLNDDPFAYVWFSCGGTGARATKDGLHATAFPSGISGVPAEVIEQLSPVVMYAREIRQDSGGPGQFRGGCGQRLVLGVRTTRPYTFSGLFDRLHNPAQGFAGGNNGAAGSIRLSTGEVIQGKGSLELDPSTQITLELPGGGGFGPVADREPAAIERDLRTGIVSSGSATRDYGWSG